MWTSKGEGGLYDHYFDAAPGANTLDTCKDHCCHDPECKAIRFSPSAVDGPELQCLLYQRGLVAWSLERPLYEDPNWTYKGIGDGEDGEDYDPALDRLKTKELAKELVAEGIPHGEVNLCIDREEYFDVAAKYSVYDRKRREWMVFTDHLIDLNDYQVVGGLGKGGFSDVYHAQDRADGTHYAMKRIKGIFQTCDPPIEFLREMVILQELDHPNIVKISDMGTFNPQPDKRSGEDGPAVREYFQNGGEAPEEQSAAKAGAEPWGKATDMVMLLTFAPAPVTKIIKEGRMTGTLCKAVTIQLLGALKYMHSAGVIHRDINPSNVLVDEEDNNKVVVIDFNLARTNIRDSAGRARPMTPGAGTKNYTAPEVVWPKAVDDYLQAADYSVQADVWQTGICFANMLEVLPVNLETVTQSQSGKFDDITKEAIEIFDFVGLREDDIPEITRRHDGRGTKFLREYCGRSSSKVDEMCDMLPKDEADLLSQMLIFNPDKRITVDEAIDHPYFDNVRRKYGKSINKTSPYTVELAFEQGDEAGPDKIGKTRHRVYTACLEFNRRKAGYGGLKPGAQPGTVFGTRYQN